MHSRQQPERRAAPKYPKHETHDFEFDNIPHVVRAHANGEMKMCVITDSLCNAAESADATGCNSNNSNTSWTQLFRKPLKPRLSRKIVSSARTNLNRYWSKFEELLVANDASPSATASDQFAGCRSTSTRTSYRLMPPMLAALRQRRQKDAHSAPPSPPPSPLQPQQPEPQQFTVALDQNNIAAEIEVLMRKRFTVEKNLARSSMYKHFTDDSLYHGVNLNGVGDDSDSDAELRSNRSSSQCNSNCSSNRSSIASYDDAPKYPFTHRNLSMSFEDKENLENEAMEVYTTLGYETSF